jgi:hypothetical protein
MGKLIVDLSMSLDGYIAGPNDGPGNPLGEQARVIESDGVTHLRYRVVK